MREDTYNQALKIRVDEVLHYIWDPIGVCDTPEARDEYSAYSERVWQDLLGDKSASAIADYLHTVATERMGLAPNKKHDDNVAAILVDWARFLKKPYDRI